MAHLSPLAGLLDRAGNVFSLADKLGQAFHEEGQSRGVLLDPSIWERLALIFNEFCDALLDLRDAMQNPPDGFRPVAEPLQEAARIAREMHERIKTESQLESEREFWSGRSMAIALGIANPGPPAFTAYLEFSSQLISVSANGRKAVKEVATAKRLDDPFSFLDGPPAGDKTSHVEISRTSADPETTGKKPKRSTTKGEGWAKLIPALTKHHKYAENSCLNQEPIGSNQLARLADVDKSTASNFFKKEFGKHSNYRAMCKDLSSLVGALKLLNDEFSPRHLLGRKPPGEKDLNAE